MITYEVTLQVTLHVSVDVTLDDGDEDAARGMAEDVLKQAGYYALNGEATRFDYGSMNVDEVEVTAMDAYLVEEDDDDSS